MSGDRQIDPTVVHPSIALLQERFKQLERAKEMRQEKELFRMFPESSCLFGVHSKEEPVCKAGIPRFRPFKLYYWSIYGPETLSYTQLTMMIFQMLILRFIYEKYYNVSLPSNPMVSFRFFFMVHNYIAIRKAILVSFEMHSQHR
ncbi:hypothetical protein SLEP1_g46341 [Rubroshorea leprosula]|uniref:Uncharacterized protein n=1 Tax=Rubroshorea leprosula TaxID=152421 RepID=A0AAV5LMR3_9ROSI|nr:hypothetical protein SLEP1_g46341 [Rubroshorea leprosula]